MAQPEHGRPTRATAGWTPWVLGLGLLVGAGAGAAVLGTERLVRHETASGLEYQMLREGTGERAKLGDVVAAHYTGRLADGQVFDSSYVRGQPIQFRLQPGAVIDGWTEMLQLMRPGGQARAYIPAKLGYGATGAGPIPPGAELVFDIELLAAVPGGQAPR